MSVGLDLLEIERMERAIERRPRLAERLFTHAEREYASSRARPASHLAARFCAKEAVVKALGLTAWAPHEIEVLGGGDGPPELRLTGAVALRARERGVEIDVTLTHTRGVAGAVAVCRPAGPAVVAFLSDYGLADEFVGVVHGVIGRIAPGARVIDIGHGIPRQDVAAGARVLARSLPFVTAGVALAVVDPEVGARRRALALRCGDRMLVGPDNGLLVPAAERLGGIDEAVEISRSPWRLEPLSATFHGRDLFAPVAARLAAGAELAEAGTPVDPSDLVRLPARAARVEDGVLIARVAGVDAFGNVELDAVHADLAAADLRLGRAAVVRDRRLRVVRTFADVAPGEPLLYEDASGHLAIAVNTGHAADVLGLRRGDEIRVELAP